MMYGMIVVHVQAVTRNELYGYVHPATREWREGLISTTFRDMSNNKHNKHQWILLDGDIDAEWIEVSLTPVRLASALALLHLVIRAVPVKSAPCYAPAASCCKSVYTSLTVKAYVYARRSLRQQDL